MVKYLMFIRNNFLSLFLIIHLASVGQTILEDPHWELVLEDQFNDLNTSKWLVEYDWDHYASDRELQVYTNRNSNVFIRDGNLVLKVYKELYHCTSAKCNKEWYEGLNCTNKLNWNTSYYLRASNSFTIEGNFNVPLGSTLFIDVNPCH